MDFSLCQKHYFLFLQKASDKNALSFSSHLAFKSLNQSDRFYALQKLRTKNISLMEFKDLCYKTSCKYSVLRILFGALKEKGLLEKDTEDCFLVSSFFIFWRALFFLLCRIDDWI